MIFIWLINSATCITISNKANNQTAEANQQDKRSVLLGDLSYSYAATDIGSANGSHVKTITVIKNIAVPSKSHKTHQQNNNHQESSDSRHEWNNVNNQFNVVVKVPHLPDISVVDFFHHSHKTNPNDFKPSDSVSGRSPPITEKSPTQSDKTLSTDETSIRPGRVPPPIYEQIENDSLPENLQKAAIRDGTSDNVPKDVEFISILKENKPSNQLSSDIKKQTKTFIEDFSDYSMHNLKHLVDPLKFKQTHENVNQQPVAAAYEPAAEHIKAYKQQLDEQNENQWQQASFKNYGQKVEKSQSYIDISQPKPKSNGAYRVQQQPQKPYLAPSVRQYPTTTTTTTARPLFTITPTTGRRPSFTISSKVTGDNIISTTQQTPYLAPFNSKQRIASDVYNVQTVAEKPSANLQQIPGSKHNSFRSNDKLPQDNIESISSSQRLQKGNDQNHSYRSGSIDVSTKTPKDHTENTYQKKMAQRLERHQIVFEKKPPFSFLSSPF